MATITKVRIVLHEKRGGRGKGRAVTFRKKGSKETLCKIQRITIKGRSFMGRRGGRALCGPSTGKNTAAAKAARSAFRRMVKSSRRRRVVRRRGGSKRRRRG